MTKLRKASREMPEISTTVLSGMRSADDRSMGSATYKETID